MDDPKSADAGDAFDALLSLEDLARATGLHPAQVETFVQFGLLEPAGGGGEMFSLAAVDRLRTIVRLRRDLGVNLAGVAAILEMRDHLADLQRELAHLRRLLGLEG
jgi:DNA-binding transcriptional MerR regulator